MTTVAESMIFERLVTPERTNLLRFCTHVTGDTLAAEDLVQQTLLIAWQRWHTVTDPTGLPHWLKAIARNVCRHWRRGRTRQQKYLLASDQQHDDRGIAKVDLVDDIDLEFELERNELITLLDRAMDLLPPETRGLLIQHYIEELPQAELAAQIGLSTGAVGVRLHRGKLALRQALLTNFPADALAYGLVTPTDAFWTETRIWCWQCGQQRLLGHFDHTKNLLCMRCPSCCTMADENDRPSHTISDVLQGIKAYKPAMTAISKWLYSHYFEQKNAGIVPCLRCGRPIPLRNGMPPGMSGFSDAIYDWCDRCNASPCIESWSTFALQLPQVQQFWRDHPRMNSLPTQRVAIINSPAVLTGFASVTDNAKIEVAFAQNTFEVIYVEQRH